MSQGKAAVVPMTGDSNKAQDAEEPREVATHQSGMPRKQDETVPREFPKTVMVPLGCRLCFL